MNLKNELLKHCSIKNVLIILCILILLYLIYEMYVVRENFTNFETLIDSLKGISQDTNVEDYTDLDMAKICQQARKLNEICNQCNKTDNTEICFPPGIENNYDYKDLYKYDNGYIADDVGKHFGETSYSNITNTGPENNNMYKCKLKYASVDTVELNCDGALKNATLSGCDNVLTLKYKDDTDDYTYDSNNDDTNLDYFREVADNEASGNILPSGEKYFLTNLTNSPNVFKIIIDISNTNINNIQSIKTTRDDSAIEVIETEKTIVLGNLLKDTVSQDSTFDLTDKLNYKYPSGDTDYGLFLYQKDNKQIALILFGLRIDEQHITLKQNDMYTIFGTSGITITFDTDDGTTTSKLYLFQEPSTPVE